MHTDVNAHVGSTIRQLREFKLRISQDDLARRIGLSRPSIANIERGRQQISVGQLIAFANVLGVGPCALLPQATEVSAEQLSDALPPNLDARFGNWLDELQRK